jgi:hypothetical protein
MIHSYMRPHLFEQTPPVSLSKSTHCALPKMEGFNLLVSNPLRTLQKTTQGTPTLPFWNPSIFFHRSRFASPWCHIPRISAFSLAITTSTINMECGASAPLLTKQSVSPTVRFATLSATPNSSTATSTASIPGSRPIHNSRAILSKRLRLNLDIPISSANIPMLSV